MGWQALAMRWCWQHQHGNSPEEKDKGPNKGDILNGAASWTILVHYAAGISRGTRYPNHLLHKQVLQRELYAALREYLRRTIISSKMAGLMLITPDKFHIHQWHTLSMEDTSAPQQLSNSIMDHLIFCEGYLRRYYLRQRLQLALQSVQGGRSPLVHAMCPTPVQQKWAWTTRCVVSWRKRLVRLRLSGNNVNSVSEIVPKLKKSKIVAIRKHDGAIPKSCPPMANQEIPNYSRAPKDNSSSRYITAPPTPGVDRTRQQPASRGSKSPTTSLHVVRNYSQESHRRDWVSDRVGLQEHR